MQILARNVNLAQESLEFVERRIRFAVSRFADRVRSVRVRIDDLNAARGGIDKQCLVEAQLERAGKVVVDVTDAEIEPAVSRAADRLARRISDELERQRSGRRNSRSAAMVAD